MNHIETPDTATYYMLTPPATNSPATVAADAERRPNVDVAVAAARLCDVELAELFA
jgi:hypothetical protein